jgi:hypothetical protein
MIPSRILTAVGGAVAGQQFTVIDGVKALNIGESVYYVDSISTRVGEHEEFLRWEGLSHSGVGTELLRNYRH